MSKAASASISADFRHNAGKGVHELRIDGRGTSVLGKPQGDHVTSYGLVENGFYRALSGLRNEEVDNLFELGNRQSLRGKRSKIYDFISAIAVLDGGKTESLYSRVDGILDDYNRKRLPKTQIREQTRTAQDDAGLTGSNLESILSGIEMKYKENGTLMRASLKEITRLVLTFYNHVPNTAYFLIEGFAAPRDEGSIIKSALPVIESHIAASKTLKQENSVASRARLGHNLTSVIDSISSLIHYPEITRVNVVDKGKIVGTKTAEEVLGEHRSYTLTNGAKTTARARDNTKETLVNALAKHLHITFAVYPELEEVFDKREMVSALVRKVIGGKAGGANGWPTFNNAAGIADITTRVEEGLETFRKWSKDFHYTKYPRYAELESSDDEEESTKPRPRIAVAKAKALAPAQIKQEAITITEEELRELQELRKFKAIVDAKVDVSFVVQEEIKRECPTLYPNVANGKGK